VLQEKSLADLERRYPPAKRPGEDFHWYQTNCMGCGSYRAPPPPIPPAARLYDGMVVSFPPQRDLWAVVNGTRRAFPDMGASVQPSAMSAGRLSDCSRVP